MILQRFMKLFCAADAGRLRPGRRGGACLLLAVLFLCVLMTGAASAAWDGGVNETWFSDECAAGHDGSSEEKALRIYDEASLAAFAYETNMNSTSQGGFFRKTHPAYGEFGSERNCPQLETDREHDQ
jgi:hypothetical protein